jgi:fatty acid desaturase
VISGVDIRALRLALDAEGVFARRTGATLLKLAAMLAWLAACVVGLVVLPGWAAAILVPLAAVAAGTATMIGHDAGHGSLSERKWLNQLVVHLVFPLFAGVGVLHWGYKHNVSHHGQPNVVDGDRDLDLWPMASSAIDHARAGRARRWLQRRQGWLFWPMTTLLALTMRLESLRHLVRHVRHVGLDRAALADGAALLAHYVAWLVVPSIVFGAGPTFAFYAALWALVGSMLSLVFAPAHMGLPIVMRAGNRWLHQLETTRNLVLPRWLSWFFIGLDYQIEHHFFPRIPHQHLPRASAVTRAWCRELGVPHRSVGYREAVVSVTRYMASAWHLEPTEALPERRVDERSSLAA